MRRLAAIFPHPDDESLFAGGLLARAAHAGILVRVLCLTRGEAGGSRFGERGEALAERRASELRQACSILGARPPEIWSWPDGGLRTVDNGHAVTNLSAWLRDRRPQVVVSFGAVGAYGHVDHVLCAAWVQEAVQQHGPHLRLLQPSFAPGTFARLRRGLKRFAPQLLAPEATSALAEQAPEVRLALDDDARALKRSAVTAHASQLPGGEVDRFLAPGLVTALCLHERFHVAHGPALSRTTDDPFEGLPA